MDKPSKRDGLPKRAKNMKRPCAWCGEWPAAYETTEYCSFACEMASFKTVQETPKEKQNNE